ncbi:MAG: Mur ligase family protein [Lachnospiraceae bacterium]|nr:Mur ligase family protein [Lachnospiraceae bacterium]
MNYQEALQYLDELGMRSIKNPLSHTQRLLDELGAPDREVPAVHVAGTNGKGSVCSFLDSILRKSGRRTGLFTSPHLVKINERMAVDGRMISDGEFAAVFTEVREAVLRLEKEEVPEPSYFEYLYLCALQWFRKKGVEIAVIETGMGGLRDATSAGRHDILSVITSISFDHTGYLGSTIAEIAAQKAGIIREGTPCVYLASDPQVSAVIGEVLAEKSAPGFPLKPDDWEIRSVLQAKIDFSTLFRYDGHGVFSVPFAAPYQAENGALAVLAAKTLAESCPELCPGLTGEAVREGLAGMRWPARMEELRPRVYIDGAHNPDGIRRFLEAVGCILQNHRADASLVFSAVQDKDSSRMIAEIAEAVDWTRIFVTEIDGWRKTDASVLAETFRACGARDVRERPELKKALAEALAEQGEGYLFVCGSLYLSGMAEEILHDQL